MLKFTTKLSSLISVLFFLWHYFLNLFGYSHYISWQSPINSLIFNEVSMTVTRAIYIRFKCNDIFFFRSILVHFNDFILVLFNMPVITYICKQVRKVNAEQWDLQEYLVRVVQDQESLVSHIYLTELTHSLLWIGGDTLTQRQLVKKGLILRFSGYLGCIGLYLTKIGLHLWT